jgi:hypothetical protein
LLVIKQIEILWFEENSVNLIVGGNAI